MPTYFPQLNAAGMMVQIPYVVAQEALTTTADNPLGYQRAKTWRTSPLSRWQLAYPILADAEASALETFFDSMGGRFGEFIFLDPGGNLVPQSDDFSVAAWEKYNVTVGSTVTDPFGGSLARTCTATTSNGMLATMVLPDGFASGFVLTGSIYVKSASATTLSIGFIDSGFTVLGNTIWNLPANRWTRIHHTITLASTSSIRLLIGGLSTWSGALDLFGALCAPLAGPGGYIRSPENLGYHAKCRFDSDTLQLRYAGPNHKSASIPITEYK